MIYPHVTLYDGVRIGQRVRIQAGSVIGSSGFGYVFDGVGHRHLPHVGTVIVEDDVEIGANVTIDRATLGATIIGQGTKLDNLVHIAHNAQGRAPLPLRRPGRSFREVRRLGTA